MQWSAGDTSLYAVDTTIGNLSEFSADSSGLTFLHGYVGDYGPPISRIHLDATTGYLYDDNGLVVDPSTGKQVGNYTASGLIAVDAAMNRVFILGGLKVVDDMNSFTIQSFDKTNYTPISSITLWPVLGTPLAFIRWAPMGLRS